MSKVETLVAMVILGLILGLGCSLEDETPVEVEIQRPPPRPQPLALDCYDGGPTWYWDSNTSQWYWLDGQGNRHYGTPPCVDGWVEMPYTIPETRAGLGLVPDQDGFVKPLMWIERHEETAPGYNSKDDRLDLYIAAETDWLMPFDTDLGLLNAIGAESIRYYLVPIEDPGPLPAVMIRFEGIRFGDAIDLLSQLGATEVTVAGQGTSRSTRITLDGPPESYSSALVYEGEVLIATIELD